MGLRGPVPNRSDDLARPRERNGEARQLGAITTGELRGTTIPHADPEWHDTAKKIYKSARTSGQEDFYQNSDWALLWSLCEDLSDYKKASRRSAQMAQVIYSGFTSLLLSEGDRRRARLELSVIKPDEKYAELFAIDAYRADLDLDE